MKSTPEQHPWWPDCSLSLSIQLDLERGRRLIPQMHRHQLEEVTDSLLVAHAHQQSIIRQAIGRIAELESRESLQREPSSRHIQWAKGLREDLSAPPPFC